MDLDRTTRWLEDIDFLSLELPLKHKNLFFHRNKDDFFNDIDFIKANIETFSDYELNLQLAKIIASIRDAHTSIPLRINLLLPLELYWFWSGIYVTVAPIEYQDILYCKITKVNQIDIEEVIKSLRSIISYENETYLKSQLPKYIPAIELLYDLGIADDIDNLELTFEVENNKIKTLDVKSLNLKECREKLECIKNDLDYIKNLPLYRTNSKRHYWFQYIETNKIVYFKYNACKDMVPGGVFTFCKELIKFIENHVVERLIVDMRNNFGGNSSLLNSFIDDIRHSSKINKTGNLFIIIGRETFSSAILNSYSFKKNTSAIFVGESTGGKPNCYGELGRMTLKNSGLTICYSTQYYKNIEDDNVPSLLPDVYIPTTLQNYINKVDPCLEYIMSR
ncbi:S41 family peptidase [Clostridium lacusfryxellense]|uniref:S41 family peptidase n=1 Tax=Clostridium lacusfryxellense TaxID=205328 RepID=UPI001C0B34D6|nr:S41 family peptidase [Clostridium lacusfryxellense]MBU3111373.1 peptidase S41 [Clostridium lacusfryxellense]